MSDLLTTTHAADLVGWDGPNRGKRMRRYLRRRMAESGEHFVIGGTDGRHMLVTEAMLRRHCPELFKERTDFERAVKAYTEELRTQLREIRGEVTMVDNRVTELARTVAALPKCPEADTNGRRG